MNIHEDYPVGEAYLLSANGEEVGPALLFLSDGVFTVETGGVVKEVTDYDSRVTEQGLVLSSEYSEMTLSKLSLSDSKKIFPNTIRKFTSVGSLVASIKKEIMKSNSYVPTVEPEETVSITIDSSDNVLEMIRVDSEGDLFFREGGEWLKVAEDDDAPTIFDQIVIDIDLDDADRAIEYYDENVSTAESISKEEMLEFAALVQ